MFCNDIYNYSVIDEFNIKTRMRAIIFVNFKNGFALWTNIYVLLGFALNLQQRMNICYKIK